MPATQRCSECGGDLSNPGVASMHMAGVQGGTVCGVTGRLGHIEGGIAPESEPSIEDLKAEIASLNNRIATTRALHQRSATVLIDHIHRGLTPVYGDGCIECGVAWPCDTVARLDG